MRNVLIALSVVLIAVMLCSCGAVAGASSAWSNTGVEQMNEITLEKGLVIDGQFCNDGVCYVVKQNGDGLVVLDDRNNLMGINPVSMGWDVVDDGVIVGHLRLQYKVGSGESFYVVTGRGITKPTGSQNVTEYKLESGQTVCTDTHCFVIEDQDNSPVVSDLDGNLMLVEYSQSGWVVLVDDLAAFRIHKIDNGMGGYFFVAVGQFRGSSTPEPSQ